MIDTHENKFFLMNETMDAFIDDDGEETDDISDAVSSEHMIYVQNTADELRKQSLEYLPTAVVQLVRVPC